MAEQNEPAAILAEFSGVPDTSGAAESDGLHMEEAADVAFLSAHEIAGGLEDDVAKIEQAFGRDTERASMIATGFAEKISQALDYSTG